ncbi:hypothetical protein ABZ023_33780 [Streptomyces sp. NPDC006367]|uniref:hypothetical protein n=1 Tax=unclassified Streptomyces TaxID=2593676 RepID=UPI0033B96E1B
MYVWDRVSDDNLDVYDADGPEDTAAWWDDFQPDSAPDPDGEDDEDEPLPEDLDGELLDIWRQDFLTLLVPEGATRHPGTWPAVAAVWIDHNRSLDLPGSTVDEAFTVEVLREAAPIAVARWGEQTWQEHHPRWQQPTPAPARTASPPGST